MLKRGDVYRRLAAHLDLTVPDLLSTHARPSGDNFILTCGPDGFCRFFRAGLGCGVHAARPDICRAWPYFKGNLIDDSSWELAQDYCPGINPRSSHQEFVNQGVEYLETQELLDDSPDRPEALRLIPLSLKPGNKAR